MGADSPQQAAREKPRAWRWIALFLALALLGAGIAYSALRVARRARPTPVPTAAAPTPAGTPTLGLPGQPTDLRAWRRSGQTFLTWRECPQAERYRIYRHTQPIHAGNLASATLVAEVPQGSAFYRREAEGCPGVPGSSPISQTRFIVADVEGPGLGTELPEGTGLFVATTQRAGSYYYAVTAVFQGQENRTRFESNTAGPVVETVAPVGAVRVWQSPSGLAAVYTQWMPDSGWNPAWEGYAHNFYVGLPQGYLEIPDDFPLLIALHDDGESYRIPGEDETGGDGVPGDWPAIYVLPDDRCRTFWYGYGDWLRAPGDPPPPDGIVVNYTERRLAAILAFVLRTYRVDEQRVYLYGSGAGGSGALSFGLRHPELVAGVYAHAPLVDPAAAEAHRQALEAIWGPLARNVRSSDGPGVYDRMDLLSLAAQVIAPPFIAWDHGTLDPVCDWSTQGRPAIEAFQRAGLGWSGVFGPYGHEWAGFLAASAIGDTYPANPNWSLTRFELQRDESYPGLAHAGCSADPDAPSGTVNLCLEWSSSSNNFAGPPVDTPSRYEIVLRLRPGYGPSTTVDVTPRRLRSFLILPGQGYLWENRRLADGRLVARGSVEADARGLLTVRGFRVTAGGNRLILRPQERGPARVVFAFPLVPVGGAAGVTPTPQPTPTPTPAPTPTPTPHPPRSWPDTHTGIHVFNGALALRGNPAWISFAATHYAGARQLLRSEADALRAANPNWILLLDRWAIGLGHRLPDATCTPSGDFLRVIEGDAWVPEWPGEEALQPDWFFRHVGSRVYQCDEGWYLMESDNAGWRAWQAERFLRALASGDADGLLAARATIPTWLGADRWNPALPAYDPAFEEAWARRLERWLEWARQALGERYRVIADVGPWAVARDTTDYARADGVRVEGFGMDALASDGVEGWRLQMARVLALVNQDRIVLLESRRVGNAQERLFSLASYLLLKGRHTFFDLELSPEPEWWPEYTIPIGAYEGDIPHTLNELYDPAWGLYRRRYENGLVLVNPTELPVALYLGDRYYLAQPSGGGRLPEDATIPPEWTVSYIPVTQVLVPARGAAVLLEQAP